jgi:hypothetical protein
MDAGKVKIVLNALRQELHARRVAAGHAHAGSSDDAPVLPSSAAGGTHFHHDEGGANGGQRQGMPDPRAPRGGVLVQLSDSALAAAEGSPSGVRDGEPQADVLVRPIPELAVPFQVSEEPLVYVAPYIIAAVLATVAIFVLMLLAF